MSDEKYEIVCPRCLEKLKYVNIMSHLWETERESKSLSDLLLQEHIEFNELKKKVFLMLKEHETKFGNHYKHRFFIQKTESFGQAIMQNHLITTSALAHSEACRLMEENEAHSLNKTHQ